MIPKLRTLLVLMILIAFPAISWFYLNAGLKYRMERVNELSDLSSLEKTETATFDGYEFQFSQLSGKWSVIGITDPKDDYVYQDIFNRLSDAFKDRKELNFLTISDRSLDAPVFQDWLGQWKQLEYEQVFFINEHKASLAILESVVKDKESSTGRAFDHMFLVDSALVVKNVYDIRDSAQVDRLVEHIVLKLPYKK